MENITEFEDETQQNSSEESEEETPETPEGIEEGQPQQKPKYDPWQKQTHERLKKVEEAVRGKNIAGSSIPDIDAILEVQVATRDLDPTEVEELRLRAKMTGTTLTKARENENFKIWQEARQKKVEEEKTIPPSRKQNTSERSVGFEEASEEEQEKWMIEHGFLRPELSSFNKK